MLPTVVPPLPLPFSLYSHHHSYIAPSIFPASHPPSFLTPTYCPSSIHHSRSLPVTLCSSAPSLHSPLFASYATLSISIFLPDIYWALFFLISNITKPFHTHTHSRCNRAEEKTKHRPTDDFMLYKCDVYFYYCFTLILWCTKQHIIINCLALSFFPKICIKSVWYKKEWEDTKWCSCL